MDKMNELIKSIMEKRKLRPRGKEIRPHAEKVRGVN